jgi:L-amino acid N-acyltransferase YncA
VKHPMKSTQEQILVRSSTDVDIPTIAEIYAHHVRHGVASFEIEPPDPEEISRRRCAVLEHGLPWLVAEANDSVVGYAYASPYRPCAAYRFTVENSIYILCLS